MILAGIDEAGYGPTLGPLVVSGTVFRVPDTTPADSPDPPDPPDLWKVLRKSTARKPDGRRIPVDDSKKIYSTSKGVRPLEESALPFLEKLDGKLPADFRGLLRTLTADPLAGRYLDDYPWYRGRDLPIPFESFANQIRIASRRLADDLSKTGVEFLGVRAFPIEVLEFNGTIDRTGNKSEVSFEALAAILRGLWESHPAERIEVQADRQGGRMRYGPLLFSKLRPRGIRIGEETETVSSYQLCRDGPPLRVTFTVGCDGTSFPVALASLYCKYLRELHMAIFNRFWAEQVDGLRPTAGYAVDARRFLEDIAEARRRLGVDDASLIRRR